MEEPEKCKKCGQVPSLKMFEVRYSCGRIGKLFRFQCSCRMTDKMTTRDVACRVWNRMINT